MSFAVLSNPNFKLLAVSGIISGIGSSLVPMAFAIETIRVEPQGWGMAGVLITLWLGRFLGMLAYRKIGYLFKDKILLICSLTLMIVAQVGLLWCIVILGNSILLMSVSSFIYGVAASFNAPTQFVILPKIAKASELREANSILSALGDIFGIFGPIAGATLVLFLGFEFVLFLDALTFLLAIFLVMFLRIPVSPASLNKEPAVANKANTRTEKLPRWTNVCFLSWFFCAFAIGLSGVAAPTLIISNYSPATWAAVAVAMAVGSLLGSLMSLTGILDRLPWKTVHIFCSVSLATQLVALGLSVTIWVLCLIVFFSAGAVTASGIKWATMGQKQFTAAKLHRFASVDQFVSTAGLPIGMVIFGVAGTLNHTENITAIVGLLVFVATLPLIFSAKTGLPHN